MTDVINLASDNVAGAAPETRDHTLQMLRAMFELAADLERAFAVNLVGPFRLTKGLVHKSGLQATIKEEVKVFDKTLHSIVSPVCDPDGNQIGTVIVLRDITEEKQMEERKNDFLSVISHELRTPLASIGGSIFLLLCVYATVQVLQDTVIVPRVMGHATGLRPIAILLGVFIWGKLLGFLGLILAIPVTCLGIAYYRRYILHKEVVKIPA